MSSIQNLENDKTFFVKEYRTSIKNVKKKMELKKKRKFSYTYFKKIVEYLNIVK